MMIFLLALSIAVGSFLLVVLSQCHLAIGQAFAAGARSAQAVPQSAPVRPLRVVE